MIPLKLLVNLLYYLTVYCSRAVGVQPVEIYEIWERFKEAIRKFPHHGLPDNPLNEIFYLSLDETLRSLVDATFGGALIGKTYDEASALIEEMASSAHN